MVRRTHFIAVALVTALTGFASLPAAAQSARTFYIDYASGSNSNPGTKASPWKSHPYMQPGAGCTGSGAAPAYSHQAGDNFIFKGGVTWPAACFGIYIPAGGTSSAQDYYGVDKTWYSGSSWAQPLWDLNYAVTTFVVFGNTGDTGYHTFDNFEIARQGILATTSTSYASQEAFQFAGYGYTGTIIENCYIHGWATSNNVVAGTTEYSYGGVLGPGSPTPSNSIRFLNNVISDADGYLYSGGVKKSVPFGGACENCSEVAGNTFHDVMAACFSPVLCHDNEFYNIDSGSIALYDTSIHSQIIEDDSGGISYDYNNYLHDSPAAVSILVCAGSPIYNNVFSNLTNQPPIIIDTNGCYAENPATATEYIYNNTCDGTNSGGCVRLVRAGSTMGPVYLENNILINGSISVEAAMTNLVNTNNYNMTPSEASTYGFTAARKYYPSSADPNIVGKGTNLSSSCNGNLSQLCFDAEASAWYGGSQTPRPSSGAWDIGAFVAGAGGQSQSSSKPNPPTNLTASVQ